MSRIKRLPQSVINKIAAGEVIERPASVVKELMENSLDAGASRIDVAVEKGGVDLIRVADNGHGIHADELELAVASHATSKIETAEDLCHVRTLGFRGEALASIAEVSHLRIRSRSSDSDMGGELFVEGGVIRQLVPCGCPVGTVVEVRNLFFNTPVRRKFLRSTTTELAHISETVARIALAHPHVHITLMHNDRPVLQLPATDNLLERIAALYGRELAEGLIPVSSEDGPVRLFGYVAHPRFARRHAKMQFLFLNGRPIRDRNLQHALNEAYRGLLTVDRQPIAFLTLEMPPELVDVNVHPTKQEVRFLDGGRLYGQLLGTIRKEFLTTDLITRLPAGTESDQQTADTPHDPRQELAIRRQIVDWAKGELDRQRAAIQTAGVSPLSYPTSEGVSPVGDAPASQNVIAGEQPQAESPLAASQTNTASLGRPSPQGRLPMDQSPPIRALQVHNRYLVTESEDGVVVIDQHALHERILYEQLRQNIAQGRLPSQQLLIPEPVDLTPVEASLALENRELLAELGLNVEPFGGNTVLVHSYPALLRTMAPGELLRAVIAALGESPRDVDRTILLEKILHSMACKAAVKAGEQLNPDEINALLEQSRQVLHSHHCPHGRPAMLVFTREELDRYFHRT
ncbi:MAG: DNA mismatch repair endonuclease MutL [Thermogutta sp.]|nr:DNA mismatch repair endonuclease MutL [Thermogutta sp.]HOP76747.1 DNA mismatch repair endonuclease MutL [Thermogutta sp.]HQF14311.1 DNA mismatch repair endonuclease MutL [Thermogutta sp.]